ncbi:ImmA/IrrE family metallo-endopeptidase [Bradyrhizobium sp. th.b2]|uniref:ImmA/IrrE family metallo-endopeptidase n=1 Tax=Bradyrhizobium sp. th-b2 TaxID=172088 RepID=UPI0012EB9531|nr:ImmA/IrrE family metallo-endopeptidase [Bradyrhizobium sp. th.b2]
MTDVPVNPKVLIWARLERGFDVPGAAARLGVPEEELLELESGARHPSVGELRNMSAKYEIGFSSLLMPDVLPSETRLKLQDFRTHGSGAPGKWNPELLMEMDDINVLIDAMADLRDADPALFANKLPKASFATGAEKVAVDERSRVGLDVSTQAAWKTDATAFKTLRSLVEAQGVFVYQVNASTTDDWRGMAIFDERKIPVIVINSNEAFPAARSFTLFHEYAHLLLRQSAITDHRSRDANEEYCNKFAAYFLMPAQEFRGAALSVGGGFRNYWTDTHLRKIGGVFKTSMSAVALHLENLDLAPDGFFNVKVSEWRVREKKDSKPPIVPYYDKIANRLGVQHIKVVLEALDRKRINQLDAFEMLDVQASNFAKLRAKIMEREAGFGWRP